MIKGVCRLGAAAGLAFLIGGAALAGDIADKATEAETQLGSGDGPGALAAFDAATEAFWAASPLQFRIVKFANSISGYEMYEPRSSSTFHAGDTVNIYLEPVGYGFTAVGDDTKVEFTSGIEIHQRDIILGKTDDFATLDWQGRGRNYAVHAAVSVTLPDLKAGDYQLLLTLTDTATSKSATTVLPFSIE